MNIFLPEDYPLFSDKGAPPCSESDPEAFFPEVGNGMTWNSAEPAKRICRACPYVTECLAYALKNKVQGVWGGLTERERDRVVNPHRSKYQR